MKPIAVKKSARARNKCLVLIVQFVHMLRLLSTMMVPTLPMAPALPVLLLVLLLGAQPQGAVVGWKRQPCAAAVPGNEADIVTRWGATVDPTQAAPLPEHPRPQLVRADEASWANLNGIWEWQSATGVNGTVSTPPPFGRTLARSILVPFPAESCLSGVRGRPAHQMQSALRPAPFVSAWPPALRPPCCSACCR